MQIDLTSLEAQLLFWATFGIAGVLIIVGAVTTLRWCERQFRRMIQALERRWSARQAASRHAHRLVEARRSRTPEAVRQVRTVSRAPLRAEAGPRDWTPRILD